MSGHRGASAGGRAPVPRVSLRSPNCTDKLWWLLGFFDARRNFLLPSSL